MKAIELLRIGLVVTEAAACVTGIFYWSKVRNSYWKWFVIYLGVIALSEITGLLLLYQFGNTSLNMDFYKYFVIPLEFLFFFWLYYQYFKKEKKKYWALAAGVVYVLSWIVSAVFFPNVSFWSLPLSYMTGVIALLVLVIQFFLKLTWENEILGYKQNMMFWVSLALLAFYLVSSPFFILRNNWYYNYRDIFWFYFYFQFATNFMMYIFFSIAFICGKTR